MSALHRACARLHGIGIGNQHRLSVVTQKIAGSTLSRPISWMAFEQPNPCFYPPPPTLQPKRPVTVASTKAAVPGTTTPPPVTIAGIGPVPSSSSSSTTTPTTASSGSQQKISSSIPASALQTGPTPLSQIQKRTITSRQYQKRHIHQSPSMHIRKPEHTDQPPRRRIQIQEFTGNLDHRRKTRELERLSKLSESYWKRQYTTILYILEDRIDRLEAEINELDNCSDFDDFQENLETSSYMPLADPVDGNKQDPIRD